MIPAFANTVPLIGSSFDALNSQRFAWQNRNDQTEAANIARFNASQEQQNRYRFDVARQQQEAMRQDAIAREAAQRDSINLALGNRSRADEARRFDLGLKQRGEELKVQEQRYKFPIEQDKRLREEENKTVENFANEYRMPVYKAGKLRDKAESEYSKAQQEYDAVAVEFAKLPPEKSLATLVPDLKERAKVAAQILEGKAKLAEAESKLKRTVDAYEIANESLSGFAENAGQFGLALKKDGDKYAFFRPKDARTFGVYPDEIVPQATVGPAARTPQVAPRVSAPAFVPQTQTATQPALPPSVPLPRGGGTMMDFSQPKSGPKLTVEGASFFLQEAKGNKALARQLAREAGYTF